jgi:site-specific recombinase XerD
MRLDQALDLYVEQLGADGRSEHTVRQYKRHIRLLDSWFGRAIRVEDITHKDVARFLNAPEARHRPDGKPKKATSMNGLRSSLRTFFAYANAAGLTRQNPARLIRRARCAPPPPRGLSREEQDRLLAVLDEAKGDEAERDRVLFRLMLATGIRVGSALALDVEDVDVEEGELYLRSTKGDQPTMVYFNGCIADVMRAYIRDRDSGPLFESRHRLRVSARQVQRRLSHWLERARCHRASPHALRHTFGQALYERSRDPFLVQAALGHRSITSTLVYVRVSRARGATSSFGA